MAEYWSQEERGYRVRMTIDQVSQNAEANTSTIRVRLTLFNREKTFTHIWCKWYIDAFGQYIGDMGFADMPQKNSQVQFIDKTITVEHKNGNNVFGSIAYFHSYGNGSGPQDLTVGPYTITLDPIANASVLTMPSNVILGDSVNFSISKKVASAKHTLRYSWYGLEGKLADNIDTSYRWAIPESFANDIPNSSSGWGTIFLDTYIDGKLINTQSKTFTAGLSLNRVKPTFSRIALADATEFTRNITQSDRHFVSVLSKIYARFDNVQAKYGASITGYFMEIVGNNNTISAPNGTFREISVNKDTQFTLRGYVEDSRGIRSDPYEMTITVLNYFSPTLKFEVVRSGATNSTLTIKRFAKVAPLMVNGVQKNPMKLTFTTRQVDSDTETIDNGGAGGTWSQISEFNASNANLGKSYPADTSYVVVGKLEDKFTSVSFQATVTGDRIVISYDKEGIGINKYRERGALDVDGLIYSNRKQIQHHKLTEPNGAAMDTKVDNLNDYRTTGFYSILGNYRNHPASGEGAYLQVVESVSGYHQTLTTVSGRMFKRTVTSNSNGSWIEYTPKPEKPEKPEPALIKKEVDMGFGIKANMVRKGNTVMCSLVRGIYSALGGIEYKELNEKMPEGFRPVVETNLNASKNVGGNQIGVATWHLLPNGNINLTNQSDTKAVYNGTVSYITEDNYPN
ncbi:hypothetical protein HMPREF2867_10040 [Streptococcus sp. HMSC064H09]|jgi:hypothetical protein|uniref:DUF859 family phage minor structural protein n=1 Tax=Streptococcus sp. HMSC064H09 TaxID=1739371 RepID=UPI0008A27C02|nr:DUF859 family phage minor structural protein [Streptococcus sp. HMSC064H09]OFR76699.1 hypothetical protein HMPREF2867_10040 [Streptococcus sp. HMSC064H09]DAP14386.1 MAG TPA: protein of unknown function DUF859 [Caudoviricetes sp.]